MDGATVTSENLALVVMLCFAMVGVPTFERDMEQGDCALTGKWARMHLSLPPMPMWGPLVD